MQQGAKTKQLGIANRIALVQNPPNISVVHLYRARNNNTNLTNLIFDTNVTDIPLNQNNTRESTPKLPLNLLDASARDVLSSTSTKRPTGLQVDDAGSRVIIDVGTPPTPGAEEALLNRSSVLFVAVSFVLLMVISLAWLVFYYVQRFRYMHSKQRVSRRLAELAKKAVARIPVKTLHPGDKETLSDMDQCAICIEPYRPMDQLRILPCRHYFHKLCIDPWLLEQRSCPMCKLDILQAYGLRTDFYFNVSGTETASGGPSHLSLLGNVRSGLASASGSDDGMERIALVHSSSFTTCPAPSLAYVVLSTTSTTLTHLNTTVTNEAAFDSTGRCYVQNPTSDQLRLQQQQSLIQQHFVGPITQLVPVLPALTAQVGPESTTGFFVWNPDLCAVAALSAATTATPSMNLSCRDLHSTGGTSVLAPVPSCAITLQHSTESANWSTRVLTAGGSRSKIPEVTSTTQAFTSPVCSVIVDCEGNDFATADGSKVSAPFEDRLNQGTATTAVPTVGQVSPHSVDSFGSVYCVPTALRDENLVDRQLTSNMLEGSVLSYPTDARHSRRITSRPSGSRSRLHLPAVMSGINRLPVTAWLKAPWLRFRSGRFVHRDSLSPPSPPDPLLFRPNIQANSSVVPSDPLLVQTTEPREFISHPHDSISFHSSFPTNSTSKRAGSERIVVAVVEAVPDRSQTSSSNESDSGGADHNIGESIHPLPD